ncbi:RNA-dependent DNA polymerase, partial [Staphylococcus aureus]|nr:RNA-dependent DNA polymerase [Staphylococcus aureus]
NVYLHELDHYVEGLVAGFDKGAQRRKSAEYRHLQRRSEYARKRVAALRDKGQVDEIQPWLDRIKETLAAMRKLPATDPFDPDFRRLRYVRYADDFLLGVIGSRAEAEEIKAAIEGFLASELELRTSPLKSGIREARKGARFLGYDVRTRTASDRLVKQRARTGIVAVKRTVTDQIQLLVPRDKVQSFSQRHGYGQFDLG